MGSGHHHAHRPHIVSADPGPSLLRLSAGMRLGGVAVLLGILWALVLAVLG